MKILVLSRYSRKGASSRYRMFQYYPFLQAQGVQIETSPLFDDQYLELLYSRQNRFGSILRAYLQRLLLVFRSKDFDLIWIEKELFPWLPWFFERIFLRSLNKPYVVEYDDAIFHQYDQHRMGVVRTILGRKCDHLMAKSACVIAGNSYLGDRARHAGAKKIVHIPTVVSAQTFKPEHTQGTVPVIGWIGSMSTAVYLEGIRPALAALAAKFQFRVRVVGASVNWPEVPVENIPWSEKEEVRLIQSFDIGVMPLIDSPWERGKCGFKLIQYMACGKPVVADPVGVNSEIVQDGRNGYLTSASRGWEEALEDLLKSPELRNQMGEQGYQRFLQEYSQERWQQELLDLFRSLAGRPQ